MDEIGLALSPDGRTLAVTPPIVILDVTAPSGTLGHALPDDERYPTFSADGHVLATVTQSSQLRDVHLWANVKVKPTYVGTISTGHTVPVTAKAFSPDGRILAIASKDGTARLWNLRGPRHPALTAVLTGHVDEITAVMFSLDGHTLATVSKDHTARLWNLRDPRHPALIATLTGHTDEITAVTFSPDGHTLATTSPRPHRPTLGPARPPTPGADDHPHRRN